MNISFFIGGLTGGGAERVTCNLANFLISKGHDVEILTMSETDSYPLDSRVSRKILLKKNERKGFFMNILIRRKRLKSYLKQHDCDCYIVMLPITTILLLSMSKNTNAPIIASERSFPAILSPITQRLLLLLCKRAKGWVFQTPQARDWYGNNIRNAKVKIIPNAINEAFFLPPFEGEREQLIIAIGRITTGKNYALLLNAFAKIINDVQDYKIIIFGEGEKRNELIEIAKQLGISDYVEMPGYVKDIPSRLYKASLYVLTSNYEGMPNTLMEAMALGLPCISTDCDGGGAAYLIESGKNGLLVPKGDVDALADAMRRMLTDKDFAERCGREAHKICDRLAQNKIYGEWELFIKDIVG